MIIALLENRPLLLLDEWTADQDPQFRLFFYTQLLPKLKSQGKTIVLINHDDRYFSTADRVIKMEYGQIIEQWRPQKNHLARMALDTPETNPRPSADKVSSKPSRFNNQSAVDFFKNKNIVLRHIIAIQLLETLLFVGSQSILGNQTQTGLDANFIMVIFFMTLGIERR